MRAGPLSHTARGPVAVVEAPEDLDVCTASDLRKLLACLIDDHGRRLIVVDLGRTGYMDSTGLGVRLGGLKRVRAHDGQLAIVEPCDKILRILQVTGLTRVLRVAGTVDEAVAAMLESAGA
jgi:anti-sigma B factor antagonist